MENYGIVVGSAECGYSPVMPYIGEKVCGTECAKQLKYATELAALRCGFDVTDIPVAVKDASDVIIPANRVTADAAIVLAYSAFGSRKNFNDVKGCTIHHSAGRMYGASRTLCEDICSKLLMFKSSATASDGMLGGANCKSSIIDAGYLTCFDEARCAMDPDAVNAVAEHIVMGICENFGMPYLLREDICAYPTFTGGATGKRGVKIKLVQAALCLNGYEVVIDGIFGKTTELKFKEFCINNGIAGSGITHEFWRAALLTDMNAVKAASKCAEARYVSRKLRSKLYNASKLDVSDADTVRALNEFLAENGMPLASPGADIPVSILQYLSAHIGSRPRLF